MDKSTRLTQKQITVFCQNFLNTIVTYIKQDYPAFSCKAKWDWSPRRTRCWGGGVDSRGKPKGISIAMAVYFCPMISEKNPQHFFEYARIKNRADIGEFWYTNIYLGYKAIICHEVAHALCSHLYPNERIAHGEKWRIWYSKLRTKFVNGDVDLTLKGSTIHSLTKEADCYINNCEKYRLDPTWLNKVYVSKGYDMKIVGLNTRAKKYPVLIERLIDKKIYKTEPSGVIRGMLLNAK